MKITLKWLQKHDACTDGIKLFKSQTENDLVILIDKLINTNKRNYANWLLSRALKRGDKLRYAIYSAEQVLPIFESKYPTDKRPREAIEAAKKCLKHNTKANREAANNAAADDAARDAAAADAAYAAYAAAYYAALFAADYAANAAADADADAYADAEMFTKILKYGISLIES